MICYLDSNNYAFDHYHSYECVVGIGFKKSDALHLPADYTSQRNEQTAFEQLQYFFQKRKDWLFGFLTYDLKNDVEQLVSHNNDGVEMPAMCFFQPTIVLELRKSGRLVISVTEDNNWTPQLVYNELMGTMLPQYPLSSPQDIPPLQARMSRTDYLQKVRALQQHIVEGDVYEINLCQEFYAENATLEPLTIFKKLNDKTTAPFAAFVKWNDKYLMCGSPERFLKKVGNKLISQPIKGTAKRHPNHATDVQFKTSLINDPKERAENVMIVDLVRNDLTRTAQFGTIRVEELFGAYTFKTVHHLISTITAQLRAGTPFTQAIHHAFPMGSMTGAPKIMAMQLIERYELSKRGLYSGSVGYIMPSGDFDFNVVIRSILYNASNQYVSTQVGGAITYESIPEKEYEECLVKAKAMFDVLGVADIT